MTRLIFVCLFTKHTLPRKYLEYSHKIMESVRSNIINFPMEQVKNSGHKKVAINYRKGAAFCRPWVRSRRCPLRNDNCGTATKHRRMHARSFQCVYQKITKTC